MTSVKGRVPQDEQHLLHLVDGLMEHVRRELAGQDVPGLRPSHYRVLGQVPPEGVSITELAAAVRMTKQGCGQFVTQLTESGHLVVEPDPHDARVRLVRRTPAGESATRDLVRRVERIEADWTSTVGPRRYATFRAVLEELSQVE